MILTNYCQLGTNRTKKETQSALAAQFSEACRIGGMTNSLKQRTSTGIKDTFQAIFTQQLFSISTTKDKPKRQKENEIKKLLESFPEHTTSPGFRLRGNF